MLFRSGQTIDADETGGIALLVVAACGKGGDVFTIQRERRPDPCIDEVALVQFQTHLAGDMLLCGGDKGTQSFAQRAEPLAIIHQFTKGDGQLKAHLIVAFAGAASGNDSCIANVIRMSMRYGNLGTLEDGYGINLLPLATFAMDTYADDPCTIFMPKMNFADAHYNEKTLRLITQMHKAITIIQFKLEAEIIDRRPEFGMANRKLLEKIDFDRGVFVYEGKEYVLRDTNFPTVDPANPYRLDRKSVV